MEFLVIYFNNFLFFILKISNLYYLNLDFQFISKLINFQSLNV